MGFYGKSFGDVGFVEQIKENKPVQMGFYGISFGDFDFIE